MSVYIIVYFIGSMKYLQTRNETRSDDDVYSKAF